MAVESCLQSPLTIPVQMYSSYDTALFQAAADSLDPALKDLENTFAPIPPPPR